MHRRILLTFAFLGAALLANFAATTPARALSCGPCPAATTDFLNLRDAPSLDGEVLLVIPAGAEVAYDTTVPQQNGYYAVSYNGVDGYAHGLYLLLFPAFATPTDWLNLRTGPSLDSAVIEVMPPGSSVDVLGLGENGFYSVRFEQRVIGFASSDYLTLDHTGGFTEGDAVVVRADALNLRKGAGLHELVLDVLFTGAELEIIGGAVSADGFDWYEVDAGLAGSGWVAGEFLAYA